MSCLRRRGSISLVPGSESPGKSTIKDLAIEELTEFMLRGPRYRHERKVINVQHPKLVRFFMASLQDPDSVRRAHINRTYVDEHAIRNEKLAELDAERERDAPVIRAYLLSLVTIAAPIVIAAVLWRSVSG
ncbi:hypothetical protein AWN88_14230 [Agrobacterium tumefaciens]|nr:hypothetical protein AWN88_14230 [Agrobacterium tumefaciens]KAJ34051.1 hypothetical protein BW45_06130 [Agrobacterium tumefaciens]